MKKFLITLTMLSVIAGASAQTDTNSTSIKNFAAQSFDWLTGINYDTNVAWINTKLELNVGLAQVTGQPSASQADALYDITENFGVGGSIQYFGVGSAINEAEAILSYAVLDRGDLKIELQARAGWDWQSSDGVIEPTLLLKKKMTRLTYAEIGVSLPFEFNKTFQRNPTFLTGLGCIF